MGGVLVRGRHSLSLKMLLQPSYSAMMAQGSRDVMEPGYICYAAVALLQVWAPKV